MIKGRLSEILEMIPSRGNWSSQRSWLLAGVCAILFAMLMPREEMFPYRFQDGQPWSYRTLHAPFDFEVLYPDEQVRTEVERVNSEHAPYFYLNPEIARQQKKRFAKLVTEQADISRHDTQFDDLVRNQAAYIAFGNQILDIIFSRGIADPSEEAFRDTPGFIYLISPNSEKKVPVSEVGTINHAKNFLTDTLPFSPLRQPELILPLLEKSLAINVQYSDSLTIVHKRKKMSAVTGTGVVVRLGEQIVQSGEIVTSETVQKLQSLQRRYRSDSAPYYPVGMGLLALLVFGALLWAPPSENADLPPAYPLVSITTLTLTLAAGWLGRVGEAAPLLFPFWVLPAFFQQRTGRSVWAGIVFLTTITFSWAGGWFALQATGFLSARLFQTNQNTWKNRLLTTGCVLILQMLTLAGLALGGKLPGMMNWTDAATFLTLGMVISWAVFPAQRMMNKRT